MAVRMKAPDGCTGCSNDGIQYTVKKGVVIVPDKIVTALYPHGFVVDGAADVQDDAEAVAKVQAIESAKASVDAAQAAFDAATDDTAKAELTAVLFAAQQAFEALTEETPIIPAGE